MGKQNIGGHFMAKKSKVKLSSRSQIVRFNGILKPGVVHGFKKEGAYCEAIPDFINGKCLVRKEVDGKMVIDKIVELDDVHLLVNSGETDKYEEELISDDIIAINVRAGSKKWIVGRLKRYDIGGDWAVSRTNAINNILVEHFPRYTNHMVVKIGDAFNDKDLVPILCGVEFEVEYDECFNACGISHYGNWNDSDKIYPIPDWLKRFDKILSYY